MCLPGAVLAVPWKLLHADKWVPGARCLSLQIILCTMCVQWYPLYSLVLVRGGERGEGERSEYTLYTLYVVINSVTLLLPLSLSLSPFFLSLLFPLSPSLPLSSSLSPSPSLPISFPLLSSHLPQCLLSAHDTQSPIIVMSVTTYLALDISI